MRISIDDIKLETGLHKTVPLEISLDPVELGGQEFRFERPFTGRTEVWNVGDRLLVRASVAGEATTQCSRCLSSFTLPLTVSFEEEFVEGEPGGEEPESDQERTVSFYQGDQLDLSESLRENVMLELPMKPLCAEACEGLCPTCGSNRNQGPCECQDDKPVDPRLAALQNLLRKPDSKS